MKGKALLCIAMLLSVLAILPMPVSAGVATVKIEFIAIDGEPITRTTSLIGPPPDICHEFTIALVAEGIENQPEHGGLFNWVAALSWTAGVISVAAEMGYPKIVEGPFMKDLVPPGKTSFLFAGPTANSIPDMGCTFLVEIEALGGGDLAYITFHVDSAASTDIDITTHHFYDYPGSEIPTVAYSGHFEIPPPTPPNAEFTPATCTYIYVCENVILDASASTGGWDTVPEPGEYCPIESYLWEIDIDNDDSIDFTLDGVTAEFHCDAPGEVGITLTVYAPDPTAPDTHPDYYPYDSEKHVIHQVVKPTGPVIDVYTENGGEMPGAPSDAFGPQEEVTVYAFVTYNEEPVENKLVAFEVKDPDGITRVTRTAATGANGIATTEFRIPWEGAGAEDMFGTWCIIGTVDIAETTVNDTCCFEFGYILSIRGITVTGSPLKKGEDLGVAVDIKNIAFTSKDAFLAIVLYDECGVPIGMATGYITVDPSDGLTSVYTITIPGWAFVGTGKVYVNIFTGEVGGGGTPMCPEGETIFSILKTADP